MKSVELMSHEELVARYKAGNPFAWKAAYARAKATKFSRPSAHEAAMAQSFPLGAGFGRPGGERRIEASVNKAVNTCEAIENAKHYESKAQAFDEGRVNAQGRQIDKFSVERSIKREEQKARREQKINKAKAECEGKAAWQVTGEVWAIAHGYLSGGAHELVAGEHTEIVKKAIDEGKPVPPAVLEWYKGKVPDANPI